MLPYLSNVVGSIIQIESTLLHLFEDVLQADTFVREEPFLIAYSRDSYVIGQIPITLGAHILPS